MEKAYEWVEKMDKEYKNETNKTIQLSTVYSPSFSFPFSPTYHKTSFLNTDTVSAAFMQEEKPCILNYASYKNAGGGFLQGSKAQEEMLCYESNLYNILSAFSQYYEWNSKNTNRGLYLNRAIFSPDVIFVRNGQIRRINVLTCAAPNIASAFKNFKVWDDENEEVLKSRVKFIYDILHYNNVKTFITGAWGCGIFGQLPELVRDTFLYTPASIKNLVFAVPGNDRNTKAFEYIK